MRPRAWVAALLLGGLAFGALGCAIGGAAREVSAASLLAFLISLPAAFVALVRAFTFLVKGLDPSVPYQLFSVMALATMVGGRFVYQAPGYSAGK